MNNTTKVHTEVVVPVDVNLTNNHHLPHHSTRVIQLVDRSPPICSFRTFLDPLHNGLASGKVPGHPYYEVNKKLSPINLPASWEILGGGAFNGYKQPAPTGYGGVGLFPAGGNSATMLNTDPRLGVGAYVNLDGDSMDAFGNYADPPALNKPSLPSQWVNLDGDIVSSAGKPPFGFGGSGHIGEYGISFDDDVNWGLAKTQPGYLSAATDGTFCHCA